MLLKIFTLYERADVLDIVNEFFGSRYVKSICASLLNNDFKLNMKLSEEISEVIDLTEGKFVMFKFKDDDKFLIAERGKLSNIYALTVNRGLLEASELNDVKYGEITIPYDLEDAVKYIRLTGDNFYKKYIQPEKEVLLGQIEYLIWM